MRVAKQEKVETRGVRKRTRTRLGLVAAAEKLVAERGLDALSIDEITQAADVAKGTFYTHFPDKDALALEISRLIRLDFEARVSELNRPVIDARERMANGISSLLALAISEPVRVRAMIRLLPRAVDPETPINEGIRSDIALGLKSRVFSAPSLASAVVSLIGIALSAAMRLSDRERPVANPFEFARDIVTMVLVSLDVSGAEAARIARAAMDARKKELKS